RKRRDARLPFGVVCAGEVGLPFETRHPGQCRAVAAGERPEESPGGVVVLGDGRGEHRCAGGGGPREKLVEHSEGKPLSTRRSVDGDLPDEESLRRTWRPIGREPANQRAVPLGEDARIPEIGALKKIAV